MMRTSLALYVLKFPAMKSRAQEEVQFLDRVFPFPLKITLLRFVCMKSESVVHAFSAHIELTELKKKQ